MSDNERNVNPGAEPWPNAGHTRKRLTRSVNCCVGCEYDCRYCSAAHDAVKSFRLFRFEWPKEKILAEEVRKRRHRTRRLVVFPTQHDITIRTIEACEAVLVNLLTAGNRVLVTSKPNMPCLARVFELLAPFKRQLEFRFSITCLSERVRAFWEPHAPPIEERLDCLRLAFKSGFRTSVSADPILEPWNARELVDRVSPFVTGNVWVGKLNGLPERVELPTDDHPDYQYVRTMGTWVSDLGVGGIYQDLRHDPIIRWKDSIRKVIGLPRGVLSATDL